MFSRCLAVLCCLSLLGCPVFAADCSDPATTAYFFLTQTYGTEMTVGTGNDTCQAIHGRAAIDDLLSRVPAASPTYCTFGYCAGWTGCSTTGDAFVATSDGVGGFSQQSFVRQLNTTTTVLTYYVRANNQCSNVGGVYQRYDYNITNNILNDSCPNLGDCSIPPECSNLTKDVGEIGIDCGGTCTALCYNKCPDGTDFMLGVSGATTESADCVKQTLPDTSGNCPTGYTFVADSAFQVNGQTYSGYCESRISAILATDPATYAGPIFPAEFQAANSETTSSSTTETTNDPVTNQSTVTTTTTTTTTTPGSDPVVTTITNTTIFSGPDGTGEIVGTSETANQQAPPEENPQNYRFGSPGVDSLGAVSAEGISRFGVRADAFVVALKNAPIFEPLNAVMAGPPSGGNSASVVSLGSYGEATFDLNDYSSALNIIGWFLVGGCLIRSARLVIANK